MDAIMPNYSVAIQAVIFLVALVVVTKFILAPINEVLTGRSERIEGAEKEAERLAREGDSLDEDYRERIRKARAEIQADRARLREDAQGEERAILDKGRSEAHEHLHQIGMQIQSESAEAKSVLQKEAGALSRILAEKLLGRAVQ